VPTPTERADPDFDVADINYKTGPPSIPQLKMGRLVGFVFWTSRRAIIDGYVAAPSQKLSQPFNFRRAPTSNGPASFEYLQAALKKLKSSSLSPCLIIFVLLFIICAL